MVQTWAWVLIVFVGQVLGAPPEGYSEPAGWSARIEALRASPLVRVSSLATTAGGKSVDLLTLREADSWEKPARPAILVVGNVSAPHLVGGEIALGLAEWIVAHAGEQEVRTLLATNTLYVVPRPNPDGNDRLFRVPTHEADGNGRRTDDDRDFELGEDPPDDLNGDGLITQMRVADPAGTHRAHPEDGRLMIPADPARGEVGTHRLYVEGVDQDRDEQWNEDAGLGVAFDRNFPAKYKFFGLGAGPNAVSEPETRGLVNFCFDHPEIVAVLSFGLGDNLYFPPKPGGEERIRTKIQSDDAPVHEHFAKRYQEILGAKMPPTAVESAGSFGDWAYLQFGRWSFVARGWWVPAPAADASAPEAKPTSDAPAAETKPTTDAPAAGAKKKDGRDPEALAALAWFDQQKIQGVVPWTKVEHPDFPGRLVEVGGFKPLMRLNPPAQMLPALAEKHARFVMELSHATPRLVVSRQTIDRPAAGNVWRARVLLSNPSLLPTMSAMGKVAETVHPLRWTWNLPPGVSLLAGTRRGQLEPIRAGGQVEIEALLWVEPKGNEPITLSINSPGVGPLEPIRWEMTQEVKR